jgi:hypothetical protein
MDAKCSEGARLAHKVLDELSEAIQVYEEAIVLNPKIGVKRKLDALKKRVVGRQ